MRNAAFSKLPTVESSDAWSVEHFRLSAATEGSDDFDLLGSGGPHMAKGRRQIKNAFFINLMIK